tara:strand:+ start:377 stop:1060 length:684 start_codon:yes stop_codon:yes gene_type:complete
MSDMLLDDVNSLLDGDFGDDRILKQIARACKNNEVISNYERNYVQKLAEQYLGKKPENVPIEKPETPLIPDVVIPKIEPSTSSQILESQTSRNSNSKKLKLFLGFAGIGLVAIIAAVLLVSSNTDSISSDSLPPIKIELSVQSDLSSYSQTDLISINGVSVNSKIVNLSITNPNNELVWAEQVSVKNNGKYSTLAIAGGSGWEDSGSYKIKVDNGSEIKSIFFSFTS